MDGDSNCSSISRSTKNSSSHHPFWPVFQVSNSQVMVSRANFYQAQASPEYCREERALCCQRQHRALSSLQYSSKFLTPKAVLERAKNECLTLVFRSIHRAKNV